MVKIDSIVESDTSLTDKEVSRLNFVANMVVEAATGALIEIIKETSIDPLILHNTKRQREIRGITSKRKPTDNHVPISLSPFKILILHK